MKTFIILPVFKIINKAKSKPEYISQEIKIMRNLSHPNIIKFYKSYQNKHEIFIISEYCAGGSLGSFLENRQKNKKGVLREAEAYQIIKQIVSAMIYCLNLEEKFKVIHRDLKPDNILIHDKGLIKVCDFGLAKCFDWNPENTNFKTKAGSPLYMAPEMLKGLKYCTKCDVWSIGIIFYELLIGRVPWIGWGNWNSEDQLISYIEKWDIKKDEALLDLKIKPEIKEIIQQMLVKDPKKRANFKEVNEFFETKIDFFTISKEWKNEPKKIFANFETFRHTFEENQKALEEFDQVDNCYISRNMKNTQKLARTKEKIFHEKEEIKVEEEIPDLDNNNGEILEKIIDSEEIKRQEYFLQKAYDSRGLFKKSEEFFSFRLNLVFYLRRLMNSLLLYWKSLEKLCHLKSNDFIETIGVLQRLEILILLELIEFLDKKEAIENKVLQEFYMSKGCVVCYDPLIRKNLEFGLKIYSIFLNDSKNISIDAFFQNDIKNNNVNWEFVQEITQKFLEKYAKDWLKKGLDNGNVKSLMILKQLTIGKNLEVLLENFKCEGEKMYINEFYAIYAEMKNPNLDDLREFLIKKHLI